MPTQIEERLKWKYSVTRRPSWILTRPSPTRKKYERTYNLPWDRARRLKLLLRMGRWDEAASGSAGLIPELSDQNPPAVLLRLHLACLAISPGNMVLHTNRGALAHRLDVHADVLNPDVMSIQLGFQRRRRGAETRLVTGTIAPQADLVLQHNLARAHRWAKRLRKGESLSQIAKAENCSDSLIRSRVALAFLAPDLLRAILDGTAPSHLATNLIVRTTLPHDWQEQAKALGL